MPQLPGYNIGNALLDFSPVTNALQSYQKNALAQQESSRQDEQLALQKRQADMQAKQFEQSSRNNEMEYQSRLAAQAGGLGQLALSEKDPMRKAAIIQRAMTLHPEMQQNLTKAGININDPDGVANFFVTEAQAHRGYQDPVKAQMAQLEMQKTRAEINKLQMEASGAQKPLNADQRVGAEHNIRKEYSQIAKPYFDVRDAYARVEQSAKAPSAAGDLALIFNYMKMLDPGSVVREGEFATAQNAANVPDQIRNMWNRVVSGERLNDNQRGDFVGQARGLMDVQERQYKAIQDQYQGIAQRSGVDPRNVIIDFSQPQQQQPTLNFPLNAPVPKGTYKWNPDSGDLR